MLKLFEKYKYLLLIIVFSLPLFWKMLQFGMHSTQDFHLFRLYEFDKCIKNFQIPCRWAPDAGLGYGEPLFSFYGQLGYLIGEFYYLISGSLINSIKFSFIFSIIASGVSMFFLSKKLWNNSFSATLSSILYMYAPYRAVNVWVRGALPESLSFVVLPLIILAIEYKSLFWLSITTAILILTHNLSFVMFAPLIIIWLIYKKFWKGFFGFLFASLLSAFYVLPIIFESKYISIVSTTLGYFDFHNHFVELRQLLFSNYWGYGASVWGNGDGLSLAIGYSQWILPIIVLLFLLFTKKYSLLKSHFSILFLVGWFFLFLTHNKATFIWEVLPFMKYIQFPWRFLGVALFCFSLASGILFNLVKQKYLLLLIMLPTMYFVLRTAYFFRPDLWYSVKDTYYLTGIEWDRQRTASIGDFWPNFGHKIPDKPSDGKYINYFPGWSKEPNKEGLIISEGANFKNTPIRTIGNIISLLSFFGVILWRKKL